MLSLFMREQNPYTHGLSEEEEGPRTKALLPNPSLPPVYFPPHDHSCEWHFNSTNKDENKATFHILEYFSFSQDCLKIKTVKKKKKKINTVS